MRDIGDARIAIEEAISGVGEGSALPTGSTAQREPKGLPYRALPWALAGILAAVVLAILAAELWLRPEAEKNAVRFTVSAPDNHVFAPLGGFVRISPDGRKLAFASVGMDGKQQLWVRPIDGLVAKPLAGTEGSRMAVLVAGQPLHRFRCGRKTEESGSLWRAGANFV